MDSKNLLEGLDKSGKGQAITYELVSDEKIEVFIREVIRVYPQDFKAVVSSFGEWVKQWE